MLWGFPGGASGKEPTCQCRTHKRLGLDPWVGKIPWRRARQPTLVFLPGESHGQRSLVGYSPYGRKESSRHTQRSCSRSYPSPLRDPFPTLFHLASVSLSLPLTFYAFFLFSFLQLPDVVYLLNGTLCLYFSFLWVLEMLLR